MRDLGPLELRQQHASEYNIWRTILERCCNPNYADYPAYGGAGLTVAPKWRDSFPAFIKDVGPRPDSGYSLDRINNAKGYWPGNCRWATPTEQNRNRSINRLVTYQGKRMTLAELAERTGVHRMTIAHRLNKGQSMVEAIRDPQVRYEHQGHSLTLRQWSERLNVNYSTLYKRVAILHWSLARALVKG